MDPVDSYKSHVLLLLAALIGVTIASPAGAATMADPAASGLPIHRKLAAIREATSEAMMALGPSSDQPLKQDMLLAQWYSAWNNWASWASWNSWNSWSSYWGSGP